jgi:hypothetical protein
VNGESEIWQYAPGGYYYRPPNTISGGPASLALIEAIWLIRETGPGAARVWPSCVAMPVDAQP